MKKISIVDYGIGNIQSVYQAVLSCGFVPDLAINDKQISSSDFIILPGVGAFGDAVNELRQRQLFDSVISFANSGKPILGICVGMQMLFNKSFEFGEHNGLSLIEGSVERIKNQDNLRIPNISWQPLMLNENSNHPVLNEINKNDYFYFIHSYCGKPLNNLHNLAYYNYGLEQICAIAGIENVLGTQFHPEKSGKAGLNFLKSWLSLAESY